jgi:hypothetical protein
MHAAGNPANTVLDARLAPVPRAARSRWNGYENYRKVDPSSEDGSSRGDSEVAGRGEVHTDRRNPDPGAPMPQYATFCHYPTTFAADAIADVMGCYVGVSPVFVSGIRGNEKWGRETDGLPRGRAAKCFRETPKNPQESAIR